MNNPERIGLYGGTFDPIHIGHMQLALDLCEQLHLDRLLMIPAADPPHRPAPGAGAGARVQMARLAAQVDPRLCVDDCELHRPGRSYTYDTLAAWREKAPDAQLNFVLGADALLQLPSWRRWQDLLSLANIAVLARPGVTLPTDGPLADWLAAHRRTQLTAPLGQVCLLSPRLLQVSASEIRERLQSGRGPGVLLWPAVAEYIYQHKLYGALSLQEANV